MNPLVTAATNLVPSADDATQDQFVIGALVRVQFCARQMPPPLSSPIRAVHAIRTQTVFIIRPPKLPQGITIRHNHSGAEFRQKRKMDKVSSEFNPFQGC